MPGIGRDTLLGLVRGWPIAKPKSAAIPGAAGQIVDFRAVSVSSRQEAERTLGVDVSAKARYGMFSGGASVSYLDSVSISESCYNFWLIVRVTNAWQTLIDPQLKPEARAMLDTGQVIDFTKMYGDAFVSSIGTGGLLIASYSFRLRSEEKVQDIRAKVEAEANLGPGGFEVAASFRNTVSNLSENRETRTDIHSEGGDPTAIGEGKKETTLSADRLFQIATDFPAAIAKGWARLYQVQVSDYDVLHAQGTAARLKHEHARDTLQIALEHRAVAFEKYDAWRWAGENIDLFPHIKAATIEEQEAAWADAVDEYTAIAVDIAESARDGYSAEEIRGKLGQIEEVDEPDLPLPRPRYRAGRGPGKKVNPRLLRALRSRDLRREKFMQEVQELARLEAKYRSGERMHDQERDRLHRLRAQHADWLARTRTGKQVQNPRNGGRTTTPKPVTSGKPIRRG
jgi:hypothetical protein